MQRVKPLLGPASVLLPCLMITAWVGAEHHTWDELNGYLGLFVAAFLYIGTVIACGAGAVLGLLALLRREKLPFLGVFGLLLSIAFGAWILEHS